jgi:hypothetical protein
MTTHSNDECRAVAADIAFRRRALKVNSGIYARRHAPRLKPLLGGAGTITARYIGQIAWLESERDWRPQDARCLLEIADEIARLGRFQPGIAETCQWHADRLRELVEQHAVLARLEIKHQPGLAWPIARGRPAASPHRRAPVRAMARGDLRA